MSDRHYGYDMDGRPIGMAEVEELFGSPDRLIARTMITTDRGQVAVSTVFLVIDHGFTDGPPVLWESMVFGGPEDLAQRRYRSRLEAVAGHAEMVASCLRALDADGAVVVAVEQAGAGDASPS